MVYNKSIEIIMPESVVADVIAAEREFRKKIDKLDRQKQALNLIGTIAIIIMLMFMMMR